MSESASTPASDLTVPFDPDDRLTGRSRFSADIVRPGMLHVAFATSPFPHASIDSIDTSAALAMPGVHAVLTGADLGSFRFGRAIQDQPPLAVDRVLFAGQRVAAVAAETEAVAKEAATLIDVEYSALEEVLSIEQALDEGSIALHPDYDQYPGARKDRASANIQGSDRRESGDVERALSECDEVHDHTFSWARTSAAPLETHACLVDATGPMVEVIAAHKEPYRLKSDVARAIGVDEDRVMVRPINIGGDFGAKGSPLLEIVCAVLSVRTGRPVRARLTYFELLSATSARHGGTMRLTTGLRDGSIVASSVATIFDGGAYAAVKPRPTLVLPVLGVPLAPYGTISDVRETSVSVYTNSQPGGQVRSPGEYQATFAGESHVDMIARARGEDPLTFRRRLAKDPQAIKVLDGLAERIADWAGRRQEGDTAFGTGVAVFHRGAGAGLSTVTCRADSQGVTLRVATPDQGAGSYPTFAGLAARALGIAQERVHIIAAGTAAGLFDRGAGASRVTVTTGRACIEACNALLKEIGAAPSHDPTDHDGYWIGSELGERVVETIGTYESSAGEVPPAYGALAIEVAVDRLTGHVLPTKACLVLDTGPVVNPVGHRGQIEGGFVFGLSQALYEDLGMDAGYVENGTFQNYKIASAADVPELEIHVLPSEDDGIRAIGELTNLGVGPAIANAVDDAVGVRLTELPITSENIWQRLWTDGPGRV